MVDKIHVKGRLHGALHKPQSNSGRRTQECQRRVFKTTNEDFYKILHQYCFRSPRIGKVLFSTVLNLPPALNNLAGDTGVPNSDTALIFDRQQETWERTESSTRESLHSQWIKTQIHRLRTQINRLTEIKFASKQKTKRAVPVSKSWYSTPCKFSSTTEAWWSLYYLSHCTSFSGTIRKASAKEGSGLWSMLIETCFFPPKLGPREKRAIFLFSMFPNTSMSYAHKIYR